MALPVGAKTAASQAAGWIVAGGCAAFAVVYFAEIKETARLLLGLDTFQTTSANAPRAMRSEPDTVRPSRSSDRTVVLRAGRNGHHFAAVEINGRSINAVVDTGASLVALSYNDAMAAGIRVRDSDFTQRVNTANGVARSAPVMLERVSIGDIEIRNVQASVSEPGALGITLLGMSFLRRLTRFDMRDGNLLLQE